ncbi:MAG: type B diterpene cyclase [Herpetosiphon sp.]
MTPNDRRAAASSQRAIASTAYDTAWVASVPHPRDRRLPRFPAALSWLAANQLPDGSWGSPIPYIPDRIISTLAALVPMARFGKRESDTCQIRRGERYLWQSAHALHHEGCEMVGFELLLPALIRLALDIGIHVPPQLDAYAAERDRKLALLPPDVLYSRHVTIAHSLEFLGAQVNPDRLLQVRAQNGSIGNSPAATAFLLHHVDDPAAVAYLEDCLAADNGDAVSVLDPCETYEALWVAYHRFVGGVPATIVLPPSLREGLVTSLAGPGVSLSPSFPVPDADDTAVALLLLSEAGMPVDPASLEQFERDEYFVSFPYERHSSTGVNIHVLQALLRYPSYRNCQAAIAKILQFLASTRQQGSYWTDKWHVSPYYATSHAVIALADLGSDYTQQQSTLIAPALHWIVQTQNEDGSWGFYRTPTVEETAYAVLALRAFAPRPSSADQAIVAGMHYLARHIDDARPPLWIDKCLYHPNRIVDAVVNAACAEVSTQPLFIRPLLAHNKQQEGVIINE